MPRRTGSPKRLVAPKVPTAEDSLREFFPAKLAQRMKELLRNRPDNTLAIPAVKCGDGYFRVGQPTPVNRLASIDARNQSELMSEALARDIDHIAEHMAMHSEASNLLKTYWDWIYALAAHPEFQTPPEGGDWSRFPQFINAMLLLDSFLDVARRRDYDSAFGRLRSAMVRSTEDCDKVLALIADLRDAAKPNRAQMAWAAWAMIDWELGSVDEQIAAVAKMANVSPSTARSVRERFTADMEAFSITIQKADRRMD